MRSTRIFSGSVVVVASCLPLSAAHAADRQFDCIVEPRQTVELRAPIGGLIDQVLVDRGDFVSKGAVLVELDSGVERAATELAKYRSVMRGTLQSADVKLDFAKQKAARRDDLHRQRFASDQERDEAAAEKRLAEAELLEAQEARAIAELEYRRAAEQLRLRALRSPLDGVVMERYAHPGEVSDTGDGGRPLLKLAEIDTLRVEVLLPVEVYPAISQGMQATVVPDPPFGRPCPAVVKVVDRVLDAASGTFGVRLEMANPDRALPAGVKCKASFPGLGDAMAMGSLGASQSSTDPHAARAGRIR